jgi:hypothetical protein
MFNNQWSFWGKAVSSFITRRQLRALRREGKRQRSRQHSCHFKASENQYLQPLEKRVLLSGSLAGTVWMDGCQCQWHAGRR